MDLADFLRIFYDTYEEGFGELYSGDVESLNEVYAILEGDYEPEALEAAFSEAGIDESDDWPNEFWADMSSALEEADV